MLFVSALYLDNHYRYFIQTSYICKSNSDDVSCTGAITLLWTFLELFPFDHLQCYFVSALYLDNHYRYFNETSYICKAHSDDLSCTRTITLACIFFSLRLFVGLSVTKSCPLYNLITIRDISMKLHSFVKHFQTSCCA